MSASRTEVYEAIDGERDYQEARKAAEGSTSYNGKHTPEEFLIYMNSYLAEANDAAARVWGSDCKPAILNILRKVTALGVACMEENGVVYRS